MPWDLGGDPGLTYAETREFVEMLKRIYDERRKANEKANRASRKR